MAVAGVVTQTSTSWAQPILSSYFTSKGQVNRRWAVSTLARTYCIKYIKNTEHRLAAQSYIQVP